MTERADVVVVGGGILGCSASCHLGAAGAGAVQMIDRDEPGRGTSDAGAGFVALWGAGHVAAWGPAELALERYAIEHYRELHARSPIDFKQNGTIWASTGPEMWESRIRHIAECTDVTTEVLDGAQLAERTGLVRPEAVHRAVFQPDGCQISAGMATRALARLALDEGVTVASRRRVTGLRVERGRIWGIDTDAGPIESRTVVVAAGAWTNALLATAGVWLPMLPLMASRMTSGPLGVSSSMPAMIWPEFVGLWVREHHGGLVWGSGYRSEPRFAFAERPVPPRFDDVSLAGVEEMRAVGRRAADALPILAEPMDVDVAHGAPCYTADVRGLVGAVSGVDGLWVVAGCNEAGVTHGPGYGKVIADLVVDGHSDLTDVDVLRPDRFAGRFDREEQLLQYVYDAMASTAKERV